MLRLETIGRSFRLCEITLEMPSFTVKSLNPSHRPLVIDKWGVVVGHALPM
jgi:hypothetical protein